MNNTSTKVCTKAFIGGRKIWDDDYRIGYEHVGKGEGMVTLSLFLICGGC